VVDNLDSSTDLGVDTLGVSTDTGVDLEAYIGTEVDLGVHIEAGVDLEVCIVPWVHTVLEVAPQTQIVYLEVAPQAVIDHLEVENRELNLTSYKCLLHPTVYYHCFQLMTHV